jgi:hypothetical protein
MGGGWCASHTIPKGWHAVNRIIKKRILNTKYSIRNSVGIDERRMTSVNFFKNIRQNMKMVLDEMLKYGNLELGASVKLWKN